MLRNIVGDVFLCAWKLRLHIVAVLLIIQQGNVWSNVLPPLTISLITPPEDVFYTALTTHSHLLIIPQEDV